MKIWKSIAPLLLAAVMVTGCGGNSDDEEVQRYAWPLGHASTEDTVTQLFSVKFADLVEAYSDGSMRIEVYANGTIGGDRELLETCKDGDIPFVVQNTAPQVSFMQDVAVFDIPCVFDTIDEVRETVDDDVFYGLMKEVYLNAGYHLLGYADQGFREMTTNKKVGSLSDFKGQKIRTMENSFHMDFWKALGSAPTPMTFSEVYIGLQQGTIDAQENPLEVIVSSKLYEQQKYVIETNHLPHLISLIVSEDFYQELDAEQQEIIERAAEDAKVWAREQSDERIADRIENIKGSGTQIVELSEDAKAQIREAAVPVYEEIEKSIDQEIYDAYMK